MKFKKPFVKLMDPILPRKQRRIGWKSLRLENRKPT